MIEVILDNNSKYLNIILNLTNTLPFLQSVSFSGVNTGFPLVHLVELLVLREALLSRRVGQLVLVVPNPDCEVHVLVSALLHSFSLRSAGLELPGVDFHFQHIPPGSVVQALTRVKKINSRVEREI